MSGDLVAFLRARLDEDEAAAKAAAEPDWFLDSSDDSDQRSIHYIGPSTLRPGDVADYCVADQVDENDAGHIARHDPARVLREVEADRAILTEREQAHAAFEKHSASVDREVSGWWAGRVIEIDRVIRLRASVYRDHPDYRPGWAL